MKNRNYVWVVSHGTFYEGGSVVAVTQSSIEAGIIAKFIRKSDYYCRAIEYVKIEKWPFGKIDGHTEYEMLQVEPDDGGITCQNLK